eukprot:CAMPEP_0180538822 /NCGR_PEP_ID=MMETSP1036_2-20121128/66564_1 /TAXON_ID=632150 /ORGANISM="Azadinium spinosum, Strain 3D9" /LENGTH=44 /DNA_ID= /DNA_START= /DNA_END= /DNA_ORIENTATION=
MICLLKSITAELDATSLKGIQVKSMTSFGSAWSSDDSARICMAK